jgi:hypothetical protein
MESLLEHNSILNFDKNTSVCRPCLAPILELFLYISETSGHYIEQSNLQRRRWLYSGHILLDFTFIVSALEY